MRTIVPILTCLMALVTPAFANSAKPVAPKLNTGNPDPTDIYRADKIPDSLAANANAVRRFELAELEVSEADKAMIRFHEVITVLNSKSSYELSFTSYTDKFRSLEDVEIKLYDAEGRLIERHTKKDLTSTATGSGLIEDGFAHYITVPTGKYPVTIEKKYTVRFKGLLQLPTLFSSEPEQSVERSIITLKHPRNLAVNYKWYNANFPAKKTETDKAVTTTWEMTNIKAGKYEPGSGSWLYQVPGIRFNLNNIEMDGFAGDMSSWNSMGLWYNKIAKNLNRLKPEYQQQIRAMVAGVSDNREKVRILYKNLQDNFRYVSIQLGIGGFRPFPADFLHEKKYGDCKGLSNYMEACLDAVGIKSYSAWIRAGWDQIWLDPEFPNDIFNHQILMVPLEKDTVWLECTSNYNDFNHLGSFTENRYALVLTETGGKLVKTPPGKPVVNQWIGNTRITIDNEGAANSETLFDLSGEYKYDMINLNMESQDIQRTYMINRIGFFHPDGMQIQFGDRKKDTYQLQIKTFTEKIHDFKAGSKFFLKTRLYKIWGLKLDPQENRKHDYLIEHPLAKADTTSFILPEGWSVEALPRNRSGNFKLGRFESKYWYDEAKKTVYSTISFTIDSKIIPPAQYEEARKFFDQILEDGNQKIVLKSS